MTFLELIAIIMGFIGNGQHNHATDVIQENNIRSSELKQFGIQATQVGNHGATGAATYEYTTGNFVPGSALGTGVDFESDNTRLQPYYPHNPNGNGG